MAAIAASYTKIEDASSPEPDLQLPDRPITPVPVKKRVPAPLLDNTSTVDPRDPECFLKRCSGFSKSKKNKERCNAVIGKKSEQSFPPKFLPTCRAHRDQQAFAALCLYKRPDGKACGRLFRWTPPYFELCAQHQGQPDMPCYFFSLPLELRNAILRYLLPDGPIGSSTALMHGGRHKDASSGNAPSYTGLLATTVLDLLLVNRQCYRETKDLLFSTVPFTVDVRKDGMFMCGRRLLEPRRADGSSHYRVNGLEEAKQRFLKHFDWAAVKNYAVDILVENCANGPMAHDWDEEVELYDIRDYISVVVSGVLAKSRQLNKLSVRLCLADFAWTQPQILENTKLVIGPFECLRNVRQPHILGIYTGKYLPNSMLPMQRPKSTICNEGVICSVPALPVQRRLLVHSTDFDAYAKDFTRCISSKSESALTPKAPIRIMFATFRTFCSRFNVLLPGLFYATGRHAFLHRARVAREQEDVETFRVLRNELISCWHAYMVRQDSIKKGMEDSLAKMLDVDIYPSHEMGQDARYNGRMDSRPSAKGTENTLQMVSDHHPPIPIPIPPPPPPPSPPPFSSTHHPYPDTSLSHFKQPNPPTPQMIPSHYPTIPSQTPTWPCEPGPSTTEHRSDTKTPNPIYGWSPSLGPGWRSGSDDETTVVEYKGKGKGKGRILTD